ncbi:MAG: hypothetical protein HYS32_00700 [Candidatus Woesearchaeota archaeon]|nr:MAG: hypothetical protein HYS32_00700 [Candidatus Woesearchaeota archaeon]
MAYEYIWKHKEANFGKPLKKQVKGGTHITFEIVPTFKGKIIAFKRKSIPGHEEPPHAKEHPEGLLFFCHNLIRFAEPFDKFVNRVIKEQCGVSVKSYKVVDFESFYQDKDDQWALLGYVIVELNKLPKLGTYGNKIYKVIQFNSKNIPNNFAWWSKDDVKGFIKRFL